MSEWKTYTLDEVYDFASGLSKGAKDFGFGHGFLRYTDIFNNYFVPNELTGLVNSTEKEQQSCSIMRGDVFLTRTSETDEDLGMSCVALKDYPKATFNGFTKRLRAKGNVEILPEFAGFYFRSPKFRAAVSGMSSVTTRASLNNGMLAALNIVLPEISEQKRIANTLSSLHHKVALLHRQNETFELLAETLFRQLFVMEADESWKEKKMGDVITIKGGTTPSTARPEYWNGDINWTSPRDLSRNEFIYLFDTERKITEVGLSQIGSGLLPVGTVLLSSRAPIGYLAITEIPVAINQGYIAVICDKAVSNYFMFLWLKCNMETIINLGNGSTFMEISKTVFRELEFIMPPADKLQMFEELIAPIFEKIKTNSKQIQSLTQLRDILLPKLMNGEV